MIWLKNPLFGGFFLSWVISVKSASHESTRWGEIKLYVSIHISNLVGLHYWKTELSPCWPRKNTQSSVRFVNWTSSFCSCVCVHTRMGIWSAPQCKVLVVKDLWLGMKGREEKQDLTLLVVFSSHIGSSQTRYFHLHVHLKMFYGWNRTSYINGCTKSEAYNAIFVYFSPFSTLFQCYDNCILIYLFVTSWSILNSATDVLRQQPWSLFVKYLLQCEAALGVSAV